jgi:hypothetical protein
MLLRILFFVLLSHIGLLMYQEAAGAESQYWVMLRDGRTQTGSRLDGLFDTRRGRRVTLDGRPLIDNSNPLRIVHQRGASSRLRAPFIEFTNGDVFPAEVLRTEPVSHGVSDKVCVVVMPQMGDYTPEGESSQRRIRTSTIRRIVFHGVASERSQSGHLKFLDGRHVPVRSIRFTLDGVRALTDGGLVEAEFDELRELAMPRASDTTAAITDGVFPAIDAMDAVWRVRMADGGQYTVRRSLCRSGFLPDHLSRERTPFAIRPHWSLDTIHLEERDVVFVSRRRPDEIPLSALPIDSVRQRPGLYRWPYRVQENVKGEMLQVGELVADMGVGTHGSCELSFLLPKGATTFSTYVGIDRAAGQGGCVKCRIHRDAATGKPLWESGFVTGKQGPLRVGPIEIRGAKRLVLVTDHAHEGRPAGADALDIRDHVDWLMPVVSVDYSQADLPERRPEDWAPQLTGWQWDEAASGPCALNPVFSPRRHCFLFATIADAGKKATDARPIVLSRRMKVTLGNALLRIGAARDTTGARHVIGVTVEGEPHANTLNDDLQTYNNIDHFGERIWTLGGCLGQEVTLSIVARSHGNDNDPANGVVWHHVELCPLITDLPPGGQPIAPDVSLASLKPTRCHLPGSKTEAIVEGKNTVGEPLNVRGIPFATGFSVPANSWLVYKLDPKWRRFVAVVGLAEGWQAVGPYSIQLDDELVWQSKAPKTFDRDTPCQQIDVPIPPGHKEITLKALGTESSAAWAQAGFVTEPD